MSLEQISKNSMVKCLGASAVGRLRSSSDGSTHFKSCSSGQSSVEVQFHSLTTGGWVSLCVCVCVCVCVCGIAKIMSIKLESPELSMVH